MSYIKWNSFNLFNITPTVHCLFLISRGKQHCYIEVVVFICLCFYYRVRVRPKSLVRLMGVFIITTACERIILFGHVSIPAQTPLSLHLGLATHTEGRCSLPNIRFLLHAWPKCGNSTCFNGGLRQLNPGFSPWTSQWGNSVRNNLSPSNKSNSSFETFIKR